ncbi:hypothetical protein [uncultured Odoribacter sp.]|uniref:hypothetical protein n=1 Tax=uncultured Odoribacter sp. TaxID=876416 RepID=UPI00260618F7|nr:hypothetical protein [uncultured Odoribacter sp.]
MKKVKLSDFINQGGKICLPQKISIDMGYVNTLVCNLHCVSLSEPLTAVSGKDFLAKGWLAVDENGTLISLTDTDIDQKIVIVHDLHLWFALQRYKGNAQDADIVITDTLPRTKKYNF